MDETPKIQTETPKIQTETETETVNETETKEIHPDKTADEPGPNKETTVVETQSTEVVTNQPENDRKEQNETANDETTKTKQILETNPEIASSNNFLGLLPPPYSMAILKRSLNSADTFTTNEIESTQLLAPRTPMKQSYRVRSLSKPSSDSNQSISQLYSSSTSSVFNGSRPMSARLSREKDRVELSSLNDKFSEYVEKVRFLEVYNKKLQLDTNAMQDKGKESSQRVKALFEFELKQIREIIETIFKEKSGVLGSLKEYQSLIPTLKQQLNQAFKDGDSSKYETEKLEKQLSSTEGDILMFQRRLNHQECEQAQWKQFMGQLQRLALKAKNEIHSEILNRGSYEQGIKQVALEIGRMNEQHGQRTKEIQQNICGTGTSGNSDKLQMFKSDLSNAIRKIRQDFEREHENHRVTLYNRFAQSYDEIARENPEISHLFMNEREQERIRQEEERLRFEIQRLKGDINLLRQKNGDLKLRTREIQINLGMANEENGRIEKLQLNEIDQAKNRYERSIKDYEDVMKKQSTLEKEIETYRNLLEGSMKPFVDHIAEDYSSPVTNPVSSRVPNVTLMSRSRRSLSIDRNASTPFISRKPEPKFYSSLITVNTDDKTQKDSLVINIDGSHNNDKTTSKSELPIKEVETMKMPQTDDQPPKLSTDKAKMNGHLKMAASHMPIILQTRRNQ